MFSPVPRVSEIGKSVADEASGDYFDEEQKCYSLKVAQVATAAITLGVFLHMLHHKTYQDFFLFLSYLVPLFAQVSDSSVS